MTRQRTSPLRILGVVLLAAVLAFSMTACGSDSESEEPVESEAEDTLEEEAAEELEEREAVEDAAEEELQEEIEENAP